VIYGIDPWFLAGLLIWSAVAPPVGLILGWLARGQTQRRHHTHMLASGKSTSAEHWAG